MICRALLPDPKSLIPSHQSLVTFKIKKAEPTGSAFLIALLSIKRAG